MIDLIRGDKNFILQRISEAKFRYVSKERIGEYLDFLRVTKLVVQPGGRFKLTDRGLEASRLQYFNRAILAAIQAEIFTDEISFDFVEQIIKDLLFDMIPPTPVRIRDGIAMKGKRLKLGTATRVSLQLLPSTGLFLKGSADAIFPSELGG